VTACEIAAALGGACRSGEWWRCRCPVHGSRGPTLALRDGERTLVTYCHAGCDRRDILKELRRRGLIVSRAFELRPSRNSSWQQAPKRDAKDRSLEIRFILEGCRAVAGTAVDTYFQSRGLKLPNCSDLLYHDCLTDLTRTRGWPAMVAIVRNPLSGELKGIHRTYLADDGTGKAPIAVQKAMLGPCGGGAVMLKPAGEVLGLGEGIETCVAAMQARVNLPVWAALSTSGLKALPLPPMPLARTVIILCDHDRNGAGERAGRTAAQPWLRQGRSVRRAMPPEPGDVNDVLLGCASVTMEASDAP
jgi:putative DNA primase/helicase